jgi:hypothetical protein
VQLAGLLNPGGNLQFVDFVVLMDVEVAHVLLLGFAERGQGRLWPANTLLGEGGSHLQKCVLKLYCNEMTTFASWWNIGAGFPFTACPVHQESRMTDKKNLDERSERSIPLNVETLLVEGARKSKRFNPEEENEKLKKDGTDVDTIRGDLETPELVPQKKRK